MPYFSIIIPVYNVAPYLCECLDSVLAQTIADWEAICVDDGSTDGSGAILDEYAAKDKRFRVIHQGNAGVSAARNVALDVMKGEWVSFLDADDRLETSWLKSVIESVEDCVDWVRMGWTDWNGPKKEKINQLTDRMNFIITGDELLQVGWWLISRCGFPCINFYRSKLVRDVVFKEGIRFREDALFCFEMATKATGLKIIAETGYLRRIREGSAMNSARRRDDSYRLLNGYRTLWLNHVVLRTEGEHMYKSIVAASTYWVAKDVREWYCHCPDRTTSDCVEVYKCVKDLFRVGAVGRALQGSRLDWVRWRLFLKTGWFRVMLMSHCNPLGSPKC